MFLQNLRTTLILTITVPVVLLGTFGAGGVHYLINTPDAVRHGVGDLGYFLVDDAIGGGKRRTGDEDIFVAALRRRRMDARNHSGALVGIAPVLSAVFLPMVFFDGSIKGSNVSFDHRRLLMVLSRCWR